jgi:transposase
MPVATDVVSGNGADDPLYIPAMKRVREGLGEKGLLYIGDCKMGARATRAFVQEGSDYYLCPLSKTHLPDEVLETYLEPVWREEQALTDVYRERADGERVRIAEGYEREVELTAPVEDETITWTERHLLVRSLRQARAAKTRLRKRLKKALVALRALNERGRGKKRYDSVAELRQAAESVMEEHRVQGMLCVDYQTISHERTIRKYGDRPTRTVVEHEFRLSAEVDEAAVSKWLR